MVHPLELTPISGRSFKIVTFFVFSGLRQCNFTRNTIYIDLVFSDILMVTGIWFYIKVII